MIQKNNEIDKWVEYAKGNWAQILRRRCDTSSMNVKKRTLLGVTNNESLNNAKQNYVYNYNFPLLI